MIERNSHLRVPDRVVEVEGDETGEEVIVVFVDGTPRGGRLLERTPREGIVE